MLLGEAMKPSKHWKAVERRVAEFFGCKRQRCSGSSGIEGLSRSDSTHEKLFIETKYRKSHSVRTLYEETKVLAKKEGRVPVLALADHGKPGFLVVVHSSDLRAFLDATEN